jgi:glucokinase
LGGIGIASPAANFISGTIHQPANLAWGTINIVEMLKKYFNLPVAVVNDANAAAIGELKFGSAQRMNNFIVITLGTGLGAGIVVNGQLLQGGTGVAGELGHMTLDPNGRECGCGRSGCVETYISATGIRRTVFELLARRTIESPLRSTTFLELTSKKIFELARGGDVIANEAFEITGMQLGRMLANMVAVFDPTAVILTGGLANAGELILEPTRRAFEANLLSVFKGQVSILQSKLSDGRASVLGASSLVRSSLKEGVLAETDPQRSRIYEL